MQYQINVIWQILSSWLRICWKSSHVWTISTNANNKSYRKGVLWWLHTHGLHNGAKLLHTTQIRLVASFLANVKMNVTLALMVPSPSLSNNWNAFLISCNICLTVSSSIKGFILSLPLFLPGKICSCCFSFSAPNWYWWSESEGARMIMGV